MVLWLAAITEADAVYRESCDDLNGSLWGEIEGSTKLRDKND